MGQTLPQVLVGTQVWTGWKKASVSYGAKKAVRAFALTVTDGNGSPFADQWNFMPGTPVDIMENGELMCRGYIDKMTPSFEARNHHVEISGRSKSGDTVDSSAEHPTGEFRNTDILKIAKTLDKQGVGFHTDVASLPYIDVFRLNPFESVFSAVERIARKHQLILVGQGDGSIKISKGGDKRVNAALVEGDNIVGASAVFDASDKHSEYKVKGQRVFGSTKTALQITEHVKDESVKRHRPKHIHQETDVDSKDAKKRAEHHRDRQQGESISASVKVRGWRDSAGALYVPNTLIYVRSSFLKLDMDLLIENVNCTMDEGGSFTQLSLVQPKALGSKAKAGSGAALEWK